MHESGQGNNQIPAVAGRTFDVFSLSVALRAFCADCNSHICGFNFELIRPGPVHQIFAESVAHSSSSLLPERFEQQINHEVEKAIDPKNMHVVMHGNCINQSEGEWGANGLWGGRLPPDSGEHRTRPAPGTSLTKIE